MIKTKRFVALAFLLSLGIVPLWTTTLRAQSDQARQIGMHLKCMCRGCDMSAGGCSHPGGAFSGPCETAKSMLKDVDGMLAKGMDQPQIIQAFVKQYGPIVYVEPPKHGFGLVAWVMPVVYVLVGIGLVVFVMKKWLKPAHAGAAGAAAGQTSGVTNEALERAKAQAARETED